MSVDSDWYNEYGHGKRSTYQRGCKCDQCAIANSAYMKERRAGKTMSAKAKRYDSIVRLMDMYDQTGSQVALANGVRGVLNGDEDE